MNELVGIVLSAGTASRMLPLAAEKPKALFPVNNSPLLDLAIEQLSAFTDEIGVNVFHRREQIEEHLEGRAFISVEDELLGGSGALHKLRTWIDGRDALVMNVDAWIGGKLPEQLGTSSDLQMVVKKVDNKPDFDGVKFLGISRIPWKLIENLGDDKVSLWMSIFRFALAEQRVQYAMFDGAFFDCGTPPDYLAANLFAAGTNNVIGSGCQVDGQIDRCVIWPGGVVHPGEVLADSVRTPAGATLDCANWK